MSEKRETNVAPIFKKTPGFPVLDFVDCKLVDNQLIEASDGDLGGFVLRGFANTPEEALNLKHQYQDTPFPTTDQIKKVELLKIPPKELFLYQDHLTLLMNKRSDRYWEFMI